MCDIKKLSFIKEQEASGLLSYLRLERLLSRIHLLSDILS